MASKMSCASHTGTPTPVPRTRANLSFSERKAQDKNGAEPTPRPVAGKHKRRLEQARSWDDDLESPSKEQLRADLSRQRSKRSFFEDAFSVHPSSSPARERVHGDALVLAEVKTNVIVGDEFTFLTQLSYHLSARYRRPVASVVVTLRHGACMLFGGSFDPAYVMTVAALPAQLQPATNRRNAALIQRHMADALGVAPSRGLLRFAPVREEELACGGVTVAGEVEVLERGEGLRGGDGGVGWGMTSSSPGAEADEGVEGSGGSKRLRAARKKLSLRSLAPLRHSLPSAGMPTPELTPPGSADGALPPVPSPPAPPRKMADDIERETSFRASQRKLARRKKSFVASIFGRPASKASDRSFLSPIENE